MINLKSDQKLIKKYSHTQKNTIYKIFSYLHNFL